MHIHPINVPTKIISGEWLSNFHASKFFFYLPFPGTQVKNNVPRVLVAVDVMEKTHCRGSEFIVNVLPWMLPCNVYPRLYEWTQQI